MSHDIETIELTLEQAKKSIALKERLDKLHKNRDFKALIEEELLDNYTRNTVYLLSDPEMASMSDQTDLIKDLEMVGRFRQFLSAVMQKGYLAEKTIADGEKALAELRAEGVED